MTGTVYAIADAEALAPRPLPEAVAEMAGAGIRWIQVRGKKLSGEDWYRALEGCCRALEGSGAELWVDDRADLAALFPVAGLHLGQADLPPAAARGVVGRSVRIGLSTHDEAQLRAAEADPEVDVIAVGPVFPTTGKERPDPVVGLEFVARARALLGPSAKRLVAIGGIGATNIAEVLAAGADAAAVLGAVCRGDVGANCRRLLEAAGCAST
ncbi:MAG TPA: thiamine phosphate synthase [Thermoanaerobaculia bacterium]|jgi:thiamine-phosphate pyrophosphorylase|nr:thiamine phosphate synthase [Thermoanaerobaculia bacterium]